MKILITNSQRDLRRFPTSSRDDNVFQWDKINNHRITPACGEKVFLESMEPFIFSDGESWYHVRVTIPHNDIPTSMPEYHGFIKAKYIQEKDIGLVIITVNRKDAITKTSLRTFPTLDRSEHVFVKHQGTKLSVHNGDKLTLCDERVIDGIYWYRVNITNTNLFGWIQVIYCNR